MLAFTYLPSDKIGPLPMAAAHPLATQLVGLTPVNVQRMYAESQVKQRNHLQSICIFLPVAHTTTSSSGQRSASACPGPPCHRSAPPPCGVISQPAPAPSPPPP